MAAIEGFWLRKIPRFEPGAGICGLKGGFAIAAPLDNFRTANGGYSCKFSSKVFEELNLTDLDTYKSDKTLGIQGIWKEMRRFSYRFEALRAAEVMLME